MAVRRLADEQPPSFEFTPENLSWAKGKIGDYPDGRQASAVIPILWRAQEQNNGWLPEPAIRLVADMLDMPYIRVFEIATFYTMFQLQPVGSVAHINVCGTTPCMLRGAEDIVAVCKERIAHRPFELSSDGRFSWEEVECAGACVNAPMVQIGADTYEDLTAESFGRLLDALSKGADIAVGPQSARRSSEPISGVTTLTSEDTFDAPRAPADGPDSDPDPLPEKGVSPSTPAAAQEAAGKPDGSARPSVEATRATPDQGSAPGDPAPTQAAPSQASVAAAPPPDAAAAARADAAGSRPLAYAAGEIEADDLQRISGIGKVIEKTLHELG
ncbi:MAG: NADH-quinone oxidoreductase subunit NuoE, partial [Pseudomonadota bacterium]